MSNETCAARRTLTVHIPATPDPVLNPNRWTEDEVALLVRWYEEHEGRPLHLDKLAEQLGRLKPNVSRKARSLGLTNKSRVKVERIDGLRPCDIRRLPRFPTKESLRAHISLTRKQWLAEHGHPRGALGMHHTPGVKQLLTELTQKRMDAMSAEEKSIMARKAVATRLERYGHGGPVYALEENAFSRCARGRRADLGNRFFRSKWEANYARYLNFLIEQGEIASWEYEAERFVFHGETRGAITYLPDFKVTENDGSVVYHEVKGWMDGPSKTRLKRMAKHYPDVKVIVIGEDEYKAISKWKGLIPEWE